VSQRETILNHLQRFGTISPLEASHVYGVQRLASRIDELRQLGIAIITNMKKDARGHRYADYILAP
jgi:hypothetical protein